MSKIGRHIRTITKTIESVAGVTVKSVSQRKHLKFVCNTPIGEKMIVTSATPSDYRAIKNIASDVKRCINQPRGNENE